MRAERIDQLLARLARGAAAEEGAQKRPGLHVDDGLGGGDERGEQRRAGRIDGQRTQVAKPLDPDKLQCLRGGGTALREMGDDQPARLGEQRRALEAQLAQLLARGAHHVGGLRLAAEPGSGRREHRLVLARGGQIAQRTQPLPLLS
ncbi:MAG: hypothetical protein E6I84_15165, partial [Chloroflexi bacterium]